MAISNKYKDTLKDFYIDSSDIKPQYMPRPVDIESRNVMLGFKDPLTESKLDTNILDES